MQGDIFHLEQMAAQAQAPQYESTPVSLDSHSSPPVAIYNEDDLSHLLYVNHLHHTGHKDKVIINHVYRDGYSTPLESHSSGAQTPETESNETPVLSDCESDFDEGVYYPTSSSDLYGRRSPLKFEDGFEFPVFLGRQVDDESLPHATARPSLKRSDPASELSAHLDSQAQNARMAAPESTHVLEISGPLMSWWPEPLEMMEHEWVDEKVADAKNSTNVLPVDGHVSDIEGPMMSWWPAPVELLEHEWEERFYE
ncbi:hypothetical protein F4804DRAFT_317360 [Jackrogersella minutella]|nr:hypothetical protein F4804DRAFT_317360 [Jackrogersella minutella]